MKPCKKFEERISEMLFGELPENEEHMLHIHMSGCDGCMNFYLSLYETLEADENEDFSLAAEQKSEIFEVAEKLDKPIKKLSPFWTTGVSIAASLIVSGIIILSKGSRKESNYDYADKSKAVDSVNEISVKMEEASYLEIEAPAQESLAKPSKKKSTESEVSKTRRTINIDTDHAALEGESEEEPSTDDNMADQAVSDVVVSPSAFATPQVFGGRTQKAQSQKYELKEKNEPLKEALDLVLDEKPAEGLGGLGEYTSREGKENKSLENYRRNADKSKDFNKKPDTQYAINGHGLANELKPGEQNKKDEFYFGYTNGKDTPAGEKDYKDKGGSGKWISPEDKKNKEDKGLKFSNNIDKDQVVIESKFVELGQKSLQEFVFNWAPEDNKENEDFKDGSRIWNSPVDEHNDKVGKLRLQNEFNYDERQVANDILIERAKILYANRRFLEAKVALEKVLTNEPFNEDSVNLLQRTNRKLYESGRSRRTSQYEGYLAEVEWKWSDPITQFSKGTEEKQKSEDTKKVDEIIRQNKELEELGQTLNNVGYKSKEDQKGDLSNVEVALKQQRELEADNSFLSAQKYKREGNVEGAKKELEKAIQKLAELPKEPGVLAKKEKYQEFYGRLVQPETDKRPMLSTQAQPMSTFSIDVDTASYQMAKQMIQNGQRPAPLSIRAEEFINSFDYKYEAPKTKAFAVESEVVTSPFHRGSKIMKIGVQGKRPGGDHRAASHFCFIVDTSGSMADKNRLPMVKRVLPMIIKQMSPGDKVSLVSCGLNSRLELDYMDVKNTEHVAKRIESLNAVGATNLEASLNDGYRQVLKHVKKGTYSRVVLFSDGVANLGEQNADNILKKLSHARNEGVGITVIGMGEEEYNDNFLETLADKGDGNYVYIGNSKEAQKTFEKNFAATFHTIAYNVKIQVEFDPSQVSRYRLLGYENRRLKNKDFRNDKVDAGEVGSGQSVTAIYELEMTGKPSSKPMAEVRLRYRDAVDSQMKEFATPVLQKSYNTPFEKSSEATRLAFISGKFAEVLRDGGNSEGITMDSLLKYMRPLASQSNDEDIEELKNLIEKSR